MPDTGQHADTARPTEFYVELSSLLNRHSIENGSDTPDYILARFLIGCLGTFERAVRQRDSWHESVKPVWDATHPAEHIDGAKSHAEHLGDGMDHRYCDACRAEHNDGSSDGESMGE